MKIFTLILGLLFAQNICGQAFLLDSIQAIRERNLPADGESICTMEFWVADHDGGLHTFERFCKLGPEIGFAVNSVEQSEDRTVYILDFNVDGVKENEIYLFAVQRNEQWLMDGFNIAKGMIPNFIDGKCSGNFDPSSLPSDSAFARVANELLKHAKDQTKLDKYLKSITTNDSNYSSVVLQLTDEKYEATFNSTGYSKEMNKGYICLEQIAEGDAFASEITMYVERTETGEYRVYNYGFNMPNTRSFFEAN